MAVEKEIVDQQIENLGDFDRWFTKKERNYLHEIMNPDESIHAMTSGLLEGNTWLITVTDKRLIFLDKGMVYGLKQMILPMADISAVSHRTGLVLGTIEVSTAGGTKRIDSISNKDVPKIAQIISDLVQKPQDVRVIVNEPAATDDVVSQLERLANLKEKGILTEEEFNEQKVRILGS